GGKTSVKPRSRSVRCWRRQGGVHWIEGRPPGGHERRPALGGGRARFENSSRPHPQKFGQKRFLAVRGVAGAVSGVACFWATSLGKNFWRRDRDHLVPPRRTDAAVCCAEVCYPFGRKYGRHRAVRRREFVTLIGGVAAWPLATYAQQAAMPVIGLLSTVSPDANAIRLRAFREGLRTTGFVEGQNVKVDYRWAEAHTGRLPEL